MNLRTLKKLSKRAAPILTALDDRREQFPAAHPRDDMNVIHTLITAHKHWERQSCGPRFTGWNRWSTPRGADRLYTTRKGRTMVMRPPTSPRKGTIMVGSLSGYYTPEWDEETAWEALRDQVYDYFTDWDVRGDRPRITRRMRTPSDILRGAADMLAALQAQKKSPDPAAGTGAVVGMTAA